MNDLCIYHKNCNDGFAAAVVVDYFYFKNNKLVDLHPAHYGDTPPDVTNRHVIIVDFSYSREQLLEMKKAAKSLMVIDHHKTAYQDLKGLSFCEFDMTQSGSMLTWKILFPDNQPPLLLEYIQDRDLWQWKLEKSKEVSAGISLLQKNVLTWHQYLIDNSTIINQLAETGKTIVEYQNQQIKKITQSENIPFAEIAGYTVPCINTTTLISEIGNELSKGHPFCALYFETGNKRVYSLRSSPEGIDVSEIAKIFGGGGHRHAAGFQIDIPIIYL